MFVLRSETLMGQKIEGECWGDALRRREGREGAWPETQLGRYGECQEGGKAEQKGPDAGRAHCSPFLMKSEARPPGEHERGGRRCWEFKEKA